MKLLCPNCEAEGTLSVIETRQSAKIVYRTRRCDNCKWKFTTHETLADEESIPNNIRRNYSSTVESA